MQASSIDAFRRDVVGEILCPHQWHCLIWEVLSTVVTPQVVWKAHLHQASGFELNHCPTTLANTLDRNGIWYHVAIRTQSFHSKDKTQFLLSLFEIWKFSSLSPLPSIRSSGWIVPALDNPASRSRFASCVSRTHFTSPCFCLKRQRCISSWP